MLNNIYCTKKVAENNNEKLQKNIGMVQKKYI